MNPAREVKWDVCEEALREMGIVESTPYYQFWHGLMGVHRATYREMIPIIEDRLTTDSEV